MVLPFRLRSICFTVRQFLYLQCTQFGNLRTNTNGGMFGRRITEEYRQRMCMDSFGDEYVPLELVNNLRINLFPNLATILRNYTKLLKC